MRSRTKVSFLGRAGWGRNQQVEWIDHRDYLQDREKMQKKRLTLVFPMRPLLEAGIAVLSPKKVQGEEDLPTKLWLRRLQEEMVGKLRRTCRK